MRSWALACAVQLACCGCSSDGGQTGGEDFTCRPSGKGGGGSSAGVCPGGSAGSGGSRAGAGGTGGETPAPCAGGQVQLRFQQAPGSTLQTRCIDQCGWATLLVDGATVPLYGENICPRGHWVMTPEAQGYFDGRLPSGQCLQPGSYVARMCSSEVQAGTMPPPDAAPAEPGDPALPAQPMCVPGAQKCVDVSFTYPAPSGVTGLLTP